jgi:acyl-CoA synthetase (AMP-forming)/AMP-acid ligase II
MYGLTECKRVSYLDPSEIDQRPLSVGKAMDNVEVWLVDEEGRRMESGVGELVVRGSNVMQGYWERPEETARALAPGLLPGESVLRSGDLCRIDDEGFIYFIARRDDIIKSRGEKVSPKEVENAIYELPGIREAAVVGIPDPVLGQALKAYVVVAEGTGLSPHDVVLHCSQRLEDFMVPRLVEFAASLPRTGSGKVDRKQLERSEE